MPKLQRTDSGVLQAEILLSIHKKGEGVVATKIKCIHTRCPKCKAKMISVVNSDLYKCKKCILYFTREFLVDTGAIG